MTLRHLPATGYVTLPWKNGQGVTDEICLWPETGDRESFDLRISRATIAGEAPFSAFPGVDRIITVIEGAGLRLEFADHAADLAPRASYRFDSGLTPMGIPQGGPVRVLNVMVARAIWSLGTARLIGDAASVRPVPGGFAVVFGLSGHCHLSTGTDALDLMPGDTAITAIDTICTLQSGAGATLVVPVARAV